MWTARARAVSFLCSGEAELSCSLHASLAAFCASWMAASRRHLRFTCTRPSGGTFMDTGAELFRSFLNRLQNLLCSTGVSKWAFHPISPLLWRTRNRTMDAQVDKMWRIYGEPGS